jgi:pyruvate/2-oxoglutarate dehydrogenase complex dihydrolipoamide dehydrogenase (E3) component
VIGGGTAGLVTAAGTAGLGGRVALVERHKMGGDCLNYGCVPSKALIASAKFIHTTRRASSFGVCPVDPKFDFRRVFERMRARRARIAPSDSQERFESLGVDVFRGNATFLSPREVDVGAQRLRSKYFVVAAGSHAAVPPIPGLKDVRYFTNETNFDDLNEKPESLLAIGGGPIGCELSQVFQRLGVQVTLLENGPHILPREDPDVASFVEERLQDEGVRILYCSDTKSITEGDGAVRAVVAPKPPCKVNEGLIEVTAAAVLVAAGRVPNIDGLGLEAAGVKYGKRGIEVNKYLQTSQPHIYAAGDIVGPYQFTHVADFQARTVIQNTLLPFFKARMDYSVVPWSTYVDPEVAHVGLNETEANRRQIEYDSFSLPLSDVDRAVVSDEDSGFVKVLTAKGKDRILGVTIVGSHAGDLIHEFVLAMKYDIGLRKIAATIHAYPTLAEAARKLADQFNRTRLTPFAKKLFAWLYDRA